MIQVPGPGFRDEEREEGVPEIKELIHKTAYMRLKGALPSRKRSIKRRIFFLLLFYLNILDFFLYFNFQEYGVISLL